MLIKIHRRFSSNKWYIEKHGNIYSVTGENPMQYIVKDGGQHKPVLKTDCEVLEVTDVEFKPFIMELPHEELEENIDEEGLPELPSGG